MNCPSGKDKAICGRRHNLGTSHNRSWSSSVQEGHLPVGPNLHTEKQCRNKPSRWRRDLQICARVGHPAPEAQLPTAKTAYSPHGCFPIAIGICSTACVSGCGVHLLQVRCCENPRSLLKEACRPTCAAAAAVVAGLMYGAGAQRCNHALTTATL